MEVLEMKIQWMCLKAKEKASELEKRSEESNQNAAQRNKKWKMNWKTGGVPEAPGKVLTLLIKEEV